MNIEKSTVEKLTLTGINGLDPVHVIIENTAPGQGLVTISCFGESWTHFWGSMGSGTVAQFFSKCSDQYLAGKLASGIEDEIIDPDAIEKHAQAHVCKLRKQRDIYKEEARELFDEIGSTSFDDPYGEPDLMYKIYGDEWWYSLPQKVNPTYKYLCQIINAVKQALAQEMVAA